MAKNWWRLPAKHRPEHHQLGGDTIPLPLCATLTALYGLEE